MARLGARIIGFYKTMNQAHCRYAMIRRLYLAIVGDEGLLLGQTVDHLALQATASPDPLMTSSSRDGRTR